MPTLIISQINARWTGHGTGVNPGLNKPGKSTILPLPLRYRRRRDFYQVIDAARFPVFMQYDYRCLRSFRVIFMQYHCAAFLRPSWYYYPCYVYAIHWFTRRTGSVWLLFAANQGACCVFPAAGVCRERWLCQSGAWSREINGLKKY